MAWEATKGYGWTHGGWMAATFFILLTTTGCAAGSWTYYEKHEITGLTIVFLDEQSLQAKWKDIMGDAPGAPNQALMVYKERGAFDHQTNTIYCPKMDFEACGHELHYAVLGKPYVEHH